VGVTKRGLCAPPERLTELERDRIRKWAARFAPRCEPHLGLHWNQCRDWHLANGVQRANWEATFRNWLRNADLWERDHQARVGARKAEERKRAAQAKLPRLEQWPEKPTAEPVTLKATLDDLFFDP